VVDEEAGRMISKHAKWASVAAAAMLVQATVAPADGAGPPPHATPSPGGLVDLLASMRVGLSQQEAAAILAMSGPELVDYLTKLGLPVPARLRRLGPGQSPAETLSRDEVAMIVAPLASPPGEPQVRGIATDVQAHGELLRALGERFAGRIGLVRLADDGSVVVPVRDPAGPDRRAAGAMGRNVGTTVAVESLAGLTADELGVLRGEIESALKASKLTGWGVGLLGKTQSVYVSLPEGAGADVRVMIDQIASNAATLATTHRAGSAVVRGSDAVVVATGESVSTELRDKAPQGGGKWLSFDGGACTMGYVVLNAAGYAGLSAGHCTVDPVSHEGVTGTIVKNMDLSQNTGGDVHGTVSLNTYADGAVDALTWPIANWDGHTRVYLGDGWKIVQGIKPEAQQTIGLQVCGTGWGIQNVDGVNQKCDSLDILDFTFTDSNTGITTPNTNCFERRTREGDSGGPTYALDSQSRALAAGITKGWHRTHFLWFESYYWCYVTIDSALGIGGYTLPTGK